MGEEGCYSKFLLNFDYQFPQLESLSQSKERKGKAKGGGKACISAISSEDQCLLISGEMLLMKGRNLYFPVKYSSVLSSQEMTIFHLGFIKKEILKRNATSLKIL